MQRVLLPNANHPFPFAYRNRPAYRQSVGRKKNDRQKEERKTKAAEILRQLLHRRAQDRAAAERQSTDSVPRAIASDIWATLKTALINGLFAKPSAITCAEPDGDCASPMGRHENKGQERG